MNWLDIVLGIILVFFLIKGLSRGIVREVVDITAVLLTLVLAGRYGGGIGERIATALGWNKEFSSLVGFVAIAVGVAIIANAITLLWSKLGSMTPLSLFDKAGGAVVGVVKASILILIFLVILTSLPIDGSVHYIAESNLAQTFMRTLPVVYRVLDPVWPDQWPRLFVTPDGWWLQEETVRITATDEV